MQLYHFFVKTRTDPRPVEPEAPRESGSDHRWLLLTHQVPPSPSYLRVKVRRQLHRIGAVALKNSVYVLPPGDDTREDFEWLCREIERNGGEATLCLASFLDDATDARIIAAFREARAADYRSIAQAARELYTRNEEEVMKDTVPVTQKRGRKLRKWLDQVTAIDYFDASGRDEAERRISDVESLMRDAPEPQPATSSRTKSRPTGRTWVTRQGVKVDRMSSAWLIRRFIDPAATLKFVPARGYEAQPGELRFDMFDGEFTHEADHCTFETLLDRFELDDPALATLGQIIHDIDCKDEKFSRAEVSGVSAMIDGITRAHDQDEDRIQRGTALFDGLYEHFSSR